MENSSRETYEHYDLPNDRFVVLKTVIRHERRSARRGWGKGHRPWQLVRRYSMGPDGFRALAAARKTVASARRPRISTGGAEPAPEPTRPPTRLELIEHLERRGFEFSGVGRRYGHPSLPDQRLVVGRTIVRLERRGAGEGKQSWKLVRKYTLAGDAAVVLRDVDALLAST